MNCTPRRQKRNGQILIVTAFLVFMLFALAFSFFKLVPSELNSALRTKQNLSAQVIAESGVKEAKVWLESQPPQKVLTQAVIDAEFNSAAVGSPVHFSNEWTDQASSVPEGAWRYDVRLTTNPTGPYAYDVISTCYFDEEPMRQVRATLARENLSRYALFIDRWREELVMEVSGGAIQGPFHTNDFFKLIIPDDFYASPSVPFVSGEGAAMTHAGHTTEGTLPFVASSGDGNAYYSFSGPTPNSTANAVPYDASGAVSARYENIVRGGRSNIISTNHISLPYSADELLAQALGETDMSQVSIPNEVGVYLPQGPGGEVKGGIMVVGDVDISLSINAEGNQVHSLTQSIPEEAYRYDTQESFTRDVYGNVDRTLGVGDTYYQSVSNEQMVPVQRITGYETQVREVTRQRQTGQQWVSAGGGTTVGTWQPVYETYIDRIEEQVPIYETVMELRQTVNQVPVTITDPNDPQVGTVVSSYEKIDEVADTRTVSTVITAEEYEANPAAFPEATRFLRPGPPKTAEIIEVAGPTPATTFRDYDGEVHQYSGALNGVTFVDGNVASLAGVSKGAQDPRFPAGDTFQARYIVANPAISNKGKMTLTADLLQFYNGPEASLRGTLPNSLKPGELSPNSQHGLGLVSKETYLKPQKGDSLDLYAIILAGRALLDPNDPDGRGLTEGGFGSHESIMTGSYGMNTFQLFGGLVQANQQLWFRAGNGLTGNLKYDPAVAGDLPRFPRSNRVTYLRYADRYVQDANAI